VERIINIPLLIISLYQKKEQVIWFIFSDFFL